MLFRSNMRTKFSYCGRQAFTLVELLVVVAIISILAALLMTSLKGAMEAADFLRGFNLPEGSRI